LIKSEILAHLNTAWKVSGDKGIEGFYYWEQDEDASVLVSIQVTPEYRGKGCGNRMLAHWESEARKHGFNKLGLAAHTHNPAYDWYKRHGFTYFDEDGPECHMLIREVGA
jgi:GNAT superfamily N-acetyltransferase